MARSRGHSIEAMLSMGQSKPWRGVLYAMTGERQMDGGALIDYFAYSEPVKV